ncbi:MAG: LptF/LptG family permease [Alphaproteobacteria bacterium]|nr:LptF/LptG family permease [Alphaproteobacteria bacterium]
MLGQLAIATALIMSVIAVEQILHKSPELYHLVIAGALSLDWLLSIWLYILPVIFYHATPEIVSIAVAFRYYLWIENNEILILRSAGQSSRQIAYPGMIVAVLAALFCALNSLCLLPQSWARLEDIRFATAANLSVDVVQPGYQHKITPGLSVAFSRRSPDGTTLEDIVVLDGRKEHAFTQIWARRGRVLESDEASSLLLDSGAYFVHTATGIKKVDFDAFSLSVPIGAPGGAAPRPRGFYEEPVNQLLNPPIEVRNDPRVLAQWLAEGHRRIINPLLCVGNAVLVLGLLVPRRQGVGQTLMFGLAVASAFATNTLPGPLISMATLNISLMPVLYLMPTVPAIVGGVLLAGSDMRRPWLSALPCRPNYVNEIRTLIRDPN